MKTALIALALVTAAAGGAYAVQGGANGVYTLSSEELAECAAAGGCLIVPTNNVRDAMAKAYAAGREAARTEQRVSGKDCWMPS